MALFNKLFTYRKNNSSNQENNVSERSFIFNKEQVRVVLFRECDFRGRKLLFDSTSIKKVQLTYSMDNDDYTSGKSETYAEVSDGFGYMYIKPPSDANNLAEMIFGLVAMSYRGSYFKIHNLETPPRLMFTQVFPSPKYMNNRKISSSSHHNRKGRTSSQSLEHSIRLDDSGTSISDQLSVHSAASDTLLVCRHSFPLDVPNRHSGSSSSVICDSGIYGERSYSSCDGNRQLSTLPFWDTLPIKGSAISFSNSSFYKRWLRSSSIDQSITSSTSSMEETFNKPHQRSSKLGLAFVVHLTSGQEESQVQFLMEHIALIESMLWRARRATEIAYLRPNNFLSILVKMVNLTSDWLSNILSGPLLPLNLWTSLYKNYRDGDNNDKKDLYSVNNNKNGTGCDSCYYYSSNNNSIKKNNNNNIDNKCASNHHDPFTNSLGAGAQKSDFSFSNLTKLLKDEWDCLNSKVFGIEAVDLAERFVQEFCELLECVDAKHTNFFISTLLTAVLTHHLGWVSTCLPNQDNQEDSLNVDHNLPFNPLWEQLSDLYGAVGHPTKLTQTIVTGNKKKDLVMKIINCLTYFIRCCDLERKKFVRSNVDEDNKTADRICQKNSCIPKENFKKYKDHLEEMLCSNKNLEKASSNMDNLGKGSLCRAKKSNYDLKKLAVESSDSSVSDCVMRTKGLNKNANFTNLTDLSEKKVEVDDTLDEKNYCKSLEKNLYSELSNKEVVFVLGDGEELVDINKKKETNKKQQKIVGKTKKQQKQLGGNLKKENDTTNLLLESIFKKYETFEQEFSKSHFKDEDFVKFDVDSCCIKPSTSWASLRQAEEDTSVITVDDIVDVNLKLDEESNFVNNNKPFVRSQSVPPESKNMEKEAKEEVIVKAKYKYSGIKFSLHQYPQVVTNYMRSKNLEMANLSFSEITKKFDQISNEEEVNLDFSQYEMNSSDDMEALMQTPSNASELEFTSEFNVEIPRNAKESPCVNRLNGFPTKESNTLEADNDSSISMMKVVYFPMPKSQVSANQIENIPYSVSLIRGLNDSYIPDLVLQGTLAPKKEWLSYLKNELAQTSQHCLLDQRLEEAVAIIADTETWEVQLMSSHTYVIDKSSSGVRVGMSQLVASMLDSLLKMWRLQVPAKFCLMHIEQRLQALCVRSKALAQLLLDTELCSMEFLTSTLNLEVNDVPLLLAIASTYSPQVTQKYGISFQ